ncbi:MAG: hypothetical protein ACYTGV_10215, partial [Planctomycetota bacterium]
MRTFLSGILLASALLATGCSAVAAAVRHDHDLSVVRIGAARGEVERSLGGPEHTSAQYDRTDAVYEVRVSQPSSAVENLATVGGVGAGIVSAGYSQDPSGLGAVLGFIVAVPAMVGTDVYLTGRELFSGSDRRRWIWISYGSDGRVVGHRPLSREPIRLRPSTQPSREPVRPKPRYVGSSADVQPLDPSYEQLEKRWKNARSKY